MSRFRAPIPPLICPALPPRTPGAICRQLIGELYQRASLEGTEWNADLGFAATGALAAIAIDLTRLVVYGTAGSISSILADGAIREAIGAATVGAIVGALAGRQMLATMSSARLHLVVGWSLVAGGLLIGVGAL
jgi:hypothetical protein